MRDDFHIGKKEVGPLGDGETYLSAAARQMTQYGNRNRLHLTRKKPQKTPGKPRSGNRFSLLLTG